MPKRPTRLDYCQYLLASPINPALTNFANHMDDMSHDAINRFLRNEKMTPHLVWDNVRDMIAAAPTGCEVFDGTVYRQGFFVQDRVGKAAVQRQCARDCQRHRCGDVCVCESGYRRALGHRLPDLRPARRWPVQAGSCARYADRCGASQGAGLPHRAHGYVVRDEG